MYTLSLFLKISQNETLEISILPQYLNRLEKDSINKNALTGNLPSIINLIFLRTNGTTQVKVGLTILSSRPYFLILVLK